MIEFINVTKRYGNNGTNAVERLNLKVNDGEIFGFLGPNGAGKSTTIKMATGILDISEGDILVNGFSIKTDAEKAKLNIGYVSDNHAVYDKLTGNEYLSFMGAMYRVPIEDIEMRASRFSEMFSLTNSLNDRISSYSHGMKQKIAVIGALIHNPRVWILDEPLTGLDPQSAYELKTLMHEHAERGNAVFFSSHVIDVVEKVCDRVGIIDNGKLVLLGRLEELKANSTESLEQIFLDITKR
ncbi:MAG: ABC transporter ATP-binding protein [Clostridia bacterium]|nr:ABC transporter ATP-binding protein [Clostridia bacterium]